MGKLLGAGCWMLAAWSREGL
jgi:hypothetical protein